MVFHTRDSEDGIPTGYHLESHSASHWVIEELMLLANRCVAKRLAMSELSEVAVLRNHKPPDLKKAETLQKLMRERLGIKDFSMSSAFAIYKSCQDIYQKHGKMLGLCVEMMIMRAGMKQAEYFLYGVVEEEEEEHCPHHFALNFDYYTHFTSPIRRYPDVMVHRVLCALLDRQMEPRGPAEEGEEEGPAFFQTRDEAKEQVKICNEKKMNSRRCQEQLDRAVFCIYLRSMKSWCYTVGTILAMTRNERDGDSLTVYCSQLGRESKVTLCRASAEEDNVELFRNGVDDELLLPDNWEWLGRGAIQITWRSREDKEEVQKLQTLSCIPIVIIPTNTVPIDYALFVVSPFHKKYSEVKADIKESEFDGFTWTEEDEEGVDVVYDEGRGAQSWERCRALFCELLWMELLSDGGSSPSTPKQIESPVQRSVDGNPGRKSMVNALPAARRAGGVWHRSAGGGKKKSQVNSEFVKGKPTKQSATHGCRGKLAKVLQSSQLMNIMALVILVDALVTVVDVDARAAGNEPPRAMMALSDICLCMYTAELLAMIFVGGLRIFLNWMPLLDLLIVLCGYAEMVMANFLTPEEVGAMSLLRALRLVRISRLMRLLRKSRSLKELQKLATMMTTCFKALLWSFLLCFVIMTLWAMLMVEMLHPLIKDNPDFASCGDLCLEATSSVMRANLLLFQTVIAGDSWGLIAVPLILKHPETAIIFVLSLLTLVFGVLNLIVAVVIDMFAEARERDMVNLAEELEYELEDDKKYLQKLFDRMDANNDGELCFEELMAGAGRDPEFQSRLRVMDIDQADLQMLFDMVDLNGDGMIQPTEFIGPLSRWARDSKTAPRFVKYNLMKMQAQQEELFYLSDFYLRSLSDRLDTLTSKMCPNGSEGDATPRSVSKSDAEVHSVPESEVIEPPAASAPVFPPFPSHPRTEPPIDPSDLGKQLASLPAEHVEDDPLQHSEDLVRHLRSELSRTERYLHASMEESLKRSVAKIEGLLKENARVSSGPEFPPAAARPLRSSVPHAFGRKSITLHHEKLHLPTFEGKQFPHKFEALGKPPVKDLAAQPKPGVNYSPLRAMGERWLSDHPLLSCNSALAGSVWPLAVVVAFLTLAPSFVPAANKAEPQPPQQASFGILGWVHELNQFGLAETSVFAIFFLGFFIAGLVRMFNATRLPLASGCFALDSDRLESCELEMNVAALEMRSEDGAPICNDPPDAGQQDWPLAVVVAFLTLAPSFVPAANKVEPSLRGSAVLTSGAAAALIGSVPEPAHAFSETELNQFGLVFAIFFLGFFIAGLVRMFNATRLPLASGCFALDSDRQLLAPSTQRSVCGSHVVFQLRLESCELEMNVAALEIRFLS
ncbi:dis3l2 [Symbiodinium sp. CCMP2592]|nr:dis3l2 [Symbiodinium sp. CCMP2592]